MFEQDGRNEIERKQNEYNKMVRSVRRQLMSKPFCRRLKPWPDPELEVCLKIIIIIINF